jgi:hypothetical protein
VTSVLVLAAIWVVVGIPAIIGIVREKRSPDVDFARAMDALGTQPGSQGTQLRVSLATRRAQVTAGCYLSSIGVLVAGQVLDSPGILGVGVVLANLGTFYRLTVLRMQAVSAQRHTPQTGAPRAAVGAAASPPRIPRTTLGPAIEQIPGDTADERVVVLR